LARFVLHHRKLVMLVWAVVFLAGATAASRVGDRLSFDFSLPGQPGYETELDVVETYGTSTFDTFVPVLTSPDGQPVTEQQVSAVFTAVREQLPQARVVDWVSSGDERFVAEDGTTTFGLVQGPLPEGFGPGLESSWSRRWSRPPPGSAWRRR
jgi:RND superfamily putative drug exporter